MSRLLDWSDRTTCVLFGDGAGAVVLQAHEGKGDNADQGVLNTRLFSDGRLHDMLYADGGAVLDPAPPASCACRARKSSRHAVTNIAAAITASAEAAGIAVAEIDWFVPHQANQRILDGTAQQAGHRPGKGDFHRGAAWQHLGRLGAPGAGDGGPGRPHQAGRSGAAGGHGRRLYLGRRPAALVAGAGFRANSRGCAATVNCSAC